MFFSHWIFVENLEFQWSVLNQWLLSWIIIFWVIWGKVMQTPGTSDFVGLHKNKNIHVSFNKEGFHCMYYETLQSRFLPDDCLWNIAFQKSLPKVLLYGIFLHFLCMAASSSLHLIVARHIFQCFLSKRSLNCLTAMGTLMHKMYQTNSKLLQT